MSQESDINYKYSINVLYDRIERIQDDQEEIEAAQAIMQAKLNSIETQLTEGLIILNRTLPSIEKMMKETSEKIDAIHKDSVDQKIKFAVHEEKTRSNVEVLQKSGESIKKDLETQRGWLMKLILSAATGGGLVAAASEIISKMIS